MSSMRLVLALGMERSWRGFRKRLPEVEEVAAVAVGIAAGQKGCCCPGLHSEEPSARMRRHRTCDSDRRDTARVRLGSDREGRGHFSGLSK